jgi:hypothetical protein
MTRAQAGSALAAGGREPEVSSARRPIPFVVLIVGVASGAGAPVLASMANAAMGRIGGSGEHAKRPVGSNVRLNAPFSCRRRDRRLARSQMSGRRGSPSTATFPTVGRGMRWRMRLGSSWRSPARYSRLLLLNRSPGGSGSRRRRPPWTGLDMRIFASTVCLRLAAGPCSSR